MDKDAFWRGAQFAEDELMGRHEKGWFRRLWRRVYDFGQNIWFLIRHYKPSGNASYLEIPGGHQNCSGAVGMIVGAGLAENGYVNGWLWDSKFKNDRGAPGHFGTIPTKYVRIMPGDEIKRGYIILNMIYGEPPEDMASVLKELYRSMSSLKKFVASFNRIFGDGIRAEQRDGLKIPYPYWCTTHSRIVMAVVGLQLKVFSQMFLATEEWLTPESLWAGMEGETPRYIVLRPLFLYEE
jgi:hypothetical protein